MPFFQHARVDTRQPQNTSSILPDSPVGCKDDTEILQAFKIASLRSPSPARFFRPYRFFRGLGGTG